KELLAFRQRREIVAEQRRFTLNQLLGQGRVQGHGTALDRPDWSVHSRTLCFTFQSLHARFRLHGMLNAYWEPLAFELPAAAAQYRQCWELSIETALPAPDDIRRWAAAPCVDHPGSYTVQPRSVVVLAMSLQSSGVC